MTAATPAEISAAWSRVMTNDDNLIAVEIVSWFDVMGYEPNEEVGEHAAVASIVAQFDASLADRIANGFDGVRIPLAIDAVVKTVLAEFEGSFL